MRTPLAKQEIKSCKARPNATVIALVIPAIPVISIFKVPKTRNATPSQRKIFIISTIKNLADTSISGPFFLMRIAFFIRMVSSLITSQPIRIKPIAIKIRVK